MSARRLLLGLVPVLALRVSFTGELGYELYTAPEYQRLLHEMLCQAGEPAGMRHFGVRALNALRIEKGYGAWGREYTQDYTPVEAGLHRLIRTDKLRFIGRDAVLAQEATGARRKLRMLVVESHDPDPLGGEPVVFAGRPVGRLTSAAFGHTVGHSVGLAYLPTEIDASVTGLEVELLDQRLPARVLETPPYDPDGRRLRN